MTARAHPKTKSRLILLLLALITAGPFLFAYTLIQKGNALAFRLANKGELITPPINIKQARWYDLQQKKVFEGKELLGKWWLLYLGPAKCHTECQNMLYDMRQIRLALGKNANRVARLFVVDPRCPNALCTDFLSEHYSDVMQVKIDPKDFDHLLRPVSHSTRQSVVGELYLLDPKGNVMMQYAENMEPKAVLSDLKRLLKVSKI